MADCEGKIYTLPTKISNVYSISSSVLLFDAFGLLAVFQEFPGCLSGWSRRLSGRLLNVYGVEGSSQCWWRMTLFGWRGLLCFAWLDSCAASGVRAMCEVADGEPRSVQI